MEKELQRLIAECEAAYEEEKDSPFLSVIRHEEIEELRRLALRLRDAGPEELLRQLKAEQPALEQALKDEDEHPTFDWYDEHYHAKRLMGVLDAHRKVRGLLEEK